MTTGDFFFIVVYILIPLILLIALYPSVRFPIGMAVWLLLLGPLVGTWVFVAVGELAKKHPNVTLIPLAVPVFYVFFSLPIFGLWISLAGVVGWSGLRRVGFVVRMRKSRRVVAGALIGSIVGLTLIFLFWSVFSLSPDWPVHDTIGGVLSDPWAAFNVALEGAFAGAVCGPIVAWYLEGTSPRWAANRERQARASG